MKPLEKKHRNDLILIAVLLAAAGIAFGIIQLGKKSGGYAVVVQDGKEVVAAYASILIAARARSFIPELRSVIVAALLEYP